MSSLKNLAGRTAIVTGTSRGIGPHIARALVGEGMRVVVAARGREELERVAAEISAGGGTACLGVRLLNLNLDLETTSGGLSGGSSNLSPAGYEVVRRYQAVRAGLDELVLDRFQSAFRDVRI